MNNSNLIMTNPCDRVSLAAQTDSKVLKRLGISVVAVEAGSVQLEMKIEDDMVNALGICHGGFTFALADTAFAYCLVSAGVEPATMQASISYIKPAVVGEVVSATAVVSKVGKKSGFAKVTLTKGDGDLVADFMASGAVFRS
jgi:acyl-CoA thioesterase